MNTQKRNEYMALDDRIFARAVMAGEMSEGEATELMGLRAKRYAANLQASLTARAKSMLKARDVLMAIDFEDEGGRVYFGTTGQADMLKDLRHDLDEWSWDDIISDGAMTDYIGDNAALRAWKHEQLQVESQWDVQAIGKLLGLKLGDHVRPAIQPAIERLVAALRPFAEAFRKRDDPGVSDLDNEQPMSIHVPLGAWRAANALAPREATP